MKVIDISMIIREGMKEYPDNPRVRFKRVRRLPRDSANVTELIMGSHSGTHVDTPLHVDESGKDLAAFTFDQLIGKCKVVDLTAIKTGVGRDDLEKLKIRKGERLLLKTKNSYNRDDRWRDDYIYLSGEAGVYLAEKGVGLLGIDALSVKQRGSKDTRAHDALLRKGVVIVEGLDLYKVAAGRYTLIVAPLKLAGADGAPARALLIKGEIK